MFSGVALVAEACDQMVVDHAGGLHEGVDDMWADEFESGRHQFLRFLDRERRRSRHAGGGLEMVDLRPAIDEVPQEFREARTAFHDFQVGRGARYCTLA